MGTVRKATISQIILIINPAIQKLRGPSKLGMICSDLFINKMTPSIEKSIINPKPQKTAMIYFMELAPAI